MSGTLLVLAFAGAAIILEGFTALRRILRILERQERAREYEAARRLRERQQKAREHEMFRRIQGG